MQPADLKTVAKAQVAKMTQEDPRVGLAEASPAQGLEASNEAAQPAEAAQSSRMLAEEEEGDFDHLKMAAENLVATLASEVRPGLSRLGVKDLRSIDVHVA